MDFSDQIKRIMQLENIRAADLAGKTDTNEATIAEYLSGKKEPDSALNKLLSGTLPITLDDLWAAKFASIYDQGEPLDLIDYTQLGAALRAARKERSLRQLEAADALGIAPERLNAWEQGKEKIWLDHFYQACFLYGAQPFPLMRQAIRIPKPKPRAMLAQSDAPSPIQSRIILERVFEHMERHGIPLEELAETSGLSPQTLASLSRSEDVEPPTQILLTLLLALVHLMGDMLAVKEQESRNLKEKAFVHSKAERACLQGLRRLEPPVRDSLYALIEALQK